MREEKDYSNYPEADVLINYIVDRKRKGFYTLSFAVGLPGTGKTSTGIRLAELTSIALTGKNIITENNVFDDLIGFVKFVRDAKPEEVSIAVIEEVSVLFPSRRAMAEDNVAIGKILDTARKKQIIVFANAPLWPSIDSHLRALGNIYIETLHMNKKQGVVVSKALRLQTNPSSGKTYFHWFKRKGREVHRIITRKPKAETWEVYEQKKDKFMDSLYETLSYKAEKKKDKLDKEIGLRNGKIVRPLSPRYMQVYDLKYRKGMTNGEIAKELGVSPSRITYIVQDIREKLPIAHADKPMLVKTGPKETIK